MEDNRHKEMQFGLKKREELRRLEEKRERINSELDAFLQEMDYA
jgi:hypothetical protein